MREEYRVYYENYEELAQEEPGAEIPLQKDIVWENKNSQSERWKALSVFACPQGLVLELAKQVASKQYLAFYEKWKEADEDRLTDRQLSQIEAESPLGECPAVLLGDGLVSVRHSGKAGMGTVSGGRSLQAALWFRSCIPLVDRAFSFYVEAAGNCQ